MVRHFPAGDEVPAVRDVDGPDKSVSRETGEAGDDDVFLARVDSGQFDPQFVKSRLKLYADKEGNWQILEEKMRSFGLSPEQEEQWQQCSGLLADLVSGYGVALDGQGDPLAVTRKDISYAESNCEEMFAVHTARIPELLTKFQQEAAEQAETVIDYYAERKEYHKVVTAYENVVQFSGKECSDLRLREIYGRALLHTGRLEKAAFVFSQVLDESGPYEKWPLRLEVGELLIAAGQYEKARAEYLHLAEILSSWEEINKSVTDKLALLFAADDHARELALYSQALKSFLSFEGNSIPNIFQSAVRELQSKYPGGIHTTAAEVLYQQAEEQVRQQTAVNLADIEKFVDDKEFKQALGLLNSMRQSHLPADYVLQVEEMALVVNDARGQHVALKKEKHKQDMADQWQEGLNLLDMQLYDESITVFMELLGTEYDRKASVEIEKASLQAAKSLRKKAANIFVKARRATDPATRKVLLKDSRILLQTILARYPQVEIAEKVTGNLQVIDEQLLALEEL
ncbi:MAG: hypothetical protein ABFS09_06110 [Thermodesulfobacteriota bacterium]